MIAAFPKAKVVLSVREPNGWYDSIQATIAPLVAARGTHAIAHLNALTQMVHDTLFEPTFGEKLSDRAQAIEVFERHNKEVIASVPADNLLVFNVADGWEPLCAFLGVDVPDTDFPRTNSSKAFNQDVQDRKKAGRLAPP